MSSHPTTSRPCSRLLACLLALSLALPLAPTIAAEPTASPPPEEKPATPAEEELQPKFVWGLLINIVLKYAMSAFTTWLAGKVTNDIATPSNIARLTGNAATAVIVPLAKFAFGIKSAGGAENTTSDAPSTPLKLENGKENYQGVHVALLSYDRSGQPTGIKAVTAGFRTGERIKLKVLPTFDGLLVIENLTPTGERRQIYPPREGDVVSLKAGTEVLVPLAANQYFEFAGATGDEQLIVTVRDPRAFGNAESKVQANRKDDATGSSFVQETAPGTYPVISQSLRLAHGG